MPAQRVIVACVAAAVGGHVTDDVTPYRRRYVVVLVII